MCSICGRMYCPSDCPGDDGELPGVGFPVAECALCGKRLYRGARVFCRDEKTVCADCALSAQAEELLDITDCADMEELLSELGFTSENL